MVDGSWWGLAQPNEMGVRSGYGKIEGRLAKLGPQIDRLETGKASRSTGPTPGSNLGQPQLEGNLAKLFRIGKLSQYTISRLQGPITVLW